MFRLSATPRLTAAPPPPLDATKVFNFISIAQKYHLSLIYDIFAKNPLLLDYK